MSLNRLSLLLALVLLPLVAALSPPPLQDYAAVAPPCPTGTVCDRALGIAIHTQQGWLRLLPPKVPPLVIALVTRPANNLCCADYTDRLHIAAWGTTHDRNAARAASDGVNRLMNGYRTRLKSSRTPVRYGGTPGVLIRGLPSTPAPALDIVIAHAGAVYLIIAPSARLAPDQQAALAHATVMAWPMVRQGDAWLQAALSLPPLPLT